MPGTSVAEVDAEPGDIDFKKISRGLKVLGYSVLRTVRDEDVLISTASALGNVIGAQSFGVTHLRATGSDVWLGRHTETLTDAPEPIKYFALGCLVPAALGGETLLFDGRKTARLLAGSVPGAHKVRIRYRSQYRPDAADHSLIVDDDQHWPVLRFRSATENNELIAKPAGISEADLYAAVEDAHITVCYSTARQPAAPLIAALGENLPRCEVHVSALSLIIQRGPERLWDWTTVATV
ncbi:MAG TPA: TauD/TfdA family dioxygenase, partial [Streptosporangiaceae bacterium]|nr:TauD/TfdA family dioxygenase [Streptosporangiaceae bacterium]